MPSSSAKRREQLDAFERQRRTLIADLVKVDFEIAQLRSLATTALGTPEGRDNTAVDSEHGFGD
jgi:hypothetical protein